MYRVQDTDGVHVAVVVSVDVAQQHGDYGHDDPGRRESHRGDVETAEEPSSEHRRLLHGPTRRRSVPNTHSLTCSELNLRGQISNT